MSTPNILLIQSSARAETSSSRQLTRQLADSLNGTVTERDVAKGVELVDAQWVAANATPAEDRSPALNARLAGSDALVAELKAADIVVIALPIYNFGMPASLKAWVDQIARARVTFQYTADGPVGLLEGKKAYIVVTSGGVPSMSPVDFATPHLKQVLNFIGITDVTIITADQQNVIGAEAVANAAAQIADLGKAA